MNRPNRLLFACNVMVLLCVVCVGAGDGSCDAETDTLQARTLIIGKGDNAVIITNGGIHAKGITLDSQTSPATIELAALDGVAGLWIGQKGSKGRRHVAMSVTKHDGPSISMMAGKPGTVADDFRVSFDEKSHVPLIQTGGRDNKLRVIDADRMLIGGQ